MSIRTVVAFSNDAINVTPQPVGRKASQAGLTTPRPVSRCAANTYGSSAKGATSGSLHKAVRGTHRIALRSILDALTVIPIPTTGVLSGARMEADANPAIPRRAGREASYKHSITAKRTFH
jgi:hypothetical protein